MSDLPNGESLEKFAVKQNLALRDALIFLVDWRVSMVSNKCPVDSENKKAPILCSVLRSIANIMKTKVIAREMDLVSVIAFGSGGPSDRDGWPKVRTIRPLKLLDAEGIIKLERIAKSIDNIVKTEDVTTDEFLASLDGREEDLRFGENSMVEFDKALWAAKHQFRESVKDSKSVLNRRKVFVLTNDEDPTFGNAGLRKLALTQVKDLIELGSSIDVTLIREYQQPTMTASEDLHAVEECQFFDELLSIDEQDESVSQSMSITRGIASFVDLTNKIRQKEMHKRAVVRTELILGTNYKFGVAVYSLVRKAKRPGKVELFADTNEPIKRITTRTCEGIGKILRSEELRYTFLLHCLKDVRASASEMYPSHADADAAEEKTDTTKSTDTVLFGFTANELAAMQSLGVDGISLYGFKPRDSFKAEHVLQVPNFLYPDESIYEGSASLFSQLLKSMLKKNVIAIAAIKLRKKSPGPRFAALLPQQEEIGASGEQLSPAGFHMFYLPFKNDVYVQWRKELNPGKEEEEIMKDEEEIVKDEPEVMGANGPIGTEEARKFISRLTLKTYSPKFFANPDLQRFYAGLQVAAGVEDKRFSPDDTNLNPAEKDMQERVGEFLIKFKELTMGPSFNGVDIAERFGSKTLKRTREREEKEREQRVKREKVVKEARENLNIAMYIDRFREGTLQSLKKADLALYCKAFDIKHPSTANKQNLLILVENHMETQQENAKSEET